LLLHLIYLKTAGAAGSSFTTIDDVAVDHNLVTADTFCDN
jgi:hypothetical protein